MIAIIDYGAGNLNSVKKAFDLAISNLNLNLDVVLTDKEDVIKKADGIVLPGVGAFASAMKNLHDLDLIDVIKKTTQNQEKPFLGICLGYQLLLEKSYEDGEHKGLGIIKGEVKKFDLPVNYKIPHMGWNQVNFGDCPIFKGLEEDSYFYFVHSYYACLSPDESNAIALTTDYGITFASGAYKKNIFGLQFHPEKSQSNGIKVLENFCKKVGGFNI
ncbi:imidazole glycerol phosphate synthase subunit HisH [bacterium]